MRIASAKPRSVRGASHQPAFMGSCLTISHTCLPCCLVDEGPECGWNLKISLITVSHMASCNLHNIFLEAWKLAQMDHF